MDIINNIKGAVTYAASLVWHVFTDPLTTLFHKLFPKAPQVNELTLAGRKVTQTLSEVQKVAKSSFWIFRSKDVALLTAATKAKEALQDLKGKSVALSNEQQKQITNEITPLIKQALNVVEDDNRLTEEAGAAILEGLKPLQYFTQGVMRIHFNRITGLENPLIHRLKSEHIDYYHGDTSEVRAVKQNSDEIEKSLKNIIIALKLIEQDSAHESQNAIQVENLQGIAETVFEKFKTEVQPKLIELVSQEAAESVLKELEDLMEIISPRNVLEKGFDIADEAITAVTRSAWNWLKEAV